MTLNELKLIRAVLPFTPCNRETCSECQAAKIIAREIQLKLLDPRKSD